MLSNLLRAGLLIVAVALLTVFGMFDNLKNITIGYRHDAGVLDEGTLVDYHYYVVQRNKSPVAVIDGMLQRVSTWKISYVDKNGKFGACDYYTKALTGSLKLNSHVKCDKQQLQFN